MSIKIICRISGLKIHQKKPSKNLGFTILEIVFVLFLTSLIMLLAARFLFGSTGKATIEKSKTDLRKFQSAVILFYAENDRVPSCKELYETYLKGERELGFLLASSKELASLSTFSTNKDSHINDSDSGERTIQTFVPEKWLIFSKDKFLPHAEFIYAIDDKSPIAVQPG